VKRILHHLMVPVVMPAIFFTIAFTPVHVFGCRARGLMALLTAFVSGIAAVSTTVIAKKRSRLGDKAGIWWMITALILMIPVVAMIIMA
jgi:hypothetical protein